MIRSNAFCYFTQIMRELNLLRQYLVKGSVCSVLRDFFIMLEWVHDKTTYQWHTDDIPVHTNDIRMTYEYIRATYG